MNNVQSDVCPIVFSTRSWFYCLMLILHGYYNYTYMFIYRNSTNTSLTTIIWQVLCSILQNAVSWGWSFIDMTHLCIDSSVRWWVRHYLTEFIVQSSYIFLSNPVQFQVALFTVCINLADFANFCVSVFHLKSEKTKLAARPFDRVKSYDIYKAILPST